MKNTILCMYSGGLDSAYMAYILLTEEKYIDYNIHFHHIHMYNIENRQEQERIATNNTLRWLSTRCRKFLYTENSIDFNLPSQNIFPFDSDILGFVSAQVINMYPSLNYKHVAYGLNKSDVQNAVCDIRFTASMASNRLQNIFYESLRNKKDISRIYPLIELTKKQVYDMTPKELRDLTWTCRTPQTNEKGESIECGVCKSCEMMKKESIR